MGDKKHSVSGSWLGNYYYESSSQSFGFEAVFMEVNGSVEGSILDDGQLGEARVFGTFADPQLNFTKKYNNSALNAVVYQGTMTDEGKKLAGSWQISNAAKGRWIAWRQEEEDIPEMDLEDENEEQVVRERVMVRPMRSNARERELRGSSLVEQPESMKQIPD